MERIANLCDGINRGTASVIRWLALFMVLIQFAIVVGRYVFGVNSIAAQESVLYLHATLFMLGAGYTLLVDKHVRVDVFYAKADPEIRRRIDIFGHVFLLLALGSQFLEDPRRPDLGWRYRGGVSAEITDPGLLHSGDAAIGIIADRPRRPERR